MKLHKALLTLTLIAAFASMPVHAEQVGGMSRPRNIESIVAGISDPQQTTTPGIIPQSNDSSCGAASLASIVRYWLGAKDVSEASVLARFATSQSPVSTVGSAGVSIRTMIATAKAMGFVSSAHVVPVDQLQNLSKPVIALIAREAAPPHFVIVKGVRNGRVEFADVSVGMGHVHESIETFNKQWSKNGVGLLVSVDRADGMHLADSPLSLAALVGSRGVASVSVSEALLRRGGSLAAGRFRFALDYTFGRTSLNADLEMIGLKVRAHEATMSIDYAPDEATMIWASLSWINQSLRLADPAHDQGPDGDPRWSSRGTGPLIAGVSRRLPWRYDITVEPAVFIAIPTSSSTAPRLGGRLTIQGEYDKLQASVTVEIDRRLADLDRGNGESRASAAIQLAWLPLETLAVTGGINRTYRDDVGSPATSVSFGLMKAVDRELAVRATVSMSISGPSNQTFGLGIVFTPRR